MLYCQLKFSFEQIGPRASYIDICKRPHNHFSVLGKLSKLIRYCKVSQS